MNFVKRKTGEQMKPYTTLKENKDFRRLYHRGKSYVSPVLVTYVMKNRESSLRIGFTTSKKTGIAVQRNRSRRIMREAFRLIAPELKTGYDFVFCGPGKTPFVKCDAVKRAMTKQLKRGGSFQMKRPLIWFIRFYQRAISPLSKPCCKYYPTCSNYGLQAIERFGALKGGLLALWRILRCNPFSKGGYDPVPEKKEKEKE